jgi:hypothetical protein
MYVCPLTLTGIHIQRLPRRCIQRDIQTAAQQLNASLPAGGAPEEIVEERRLTCWQRWVALKKCHFIKFKGKYTEEKKAIGKLKKYVNTLN